MYRAEVDVERILSRYGEILDEILIYLNVLSGPHKSYSTGFGYPKGLNARRFSDMTLSHAIALKSS